MWGHVDVSDWDRSTGVIDVNSSMGADARGPIAVRYHGTCPMDENRGRRTLDLSLGMGTSRLGCRIRCSKEEIQLGAGIISRRGTQASVGRWLHATMACWVYSEVGVKAVQWQ